MQTSAKRSAELRPTVVCQDETTSFTGECTEPAKPSASFGPSLVTTQTLLVQQTPALAVWKYDVRSKNRPNSANCPWRNGPPVA